MEIRYFEKNIWVLENNIWVNFTAEYGAEKDIIEILSFRTSMPKTTIKNIILKAKSERVNHLHRDVLLVFKNGYMDKDLNFILNKIPFTTSQITFDYHQIPKVHPKMEKYIDWFTNGDIEKRKSALSTAMTLLTSRNDGVLGIFYSAKGGTGKTQFLSLYKEMSRPAIKNINTETVFNHNGKFSLTGSKGKTGLIGDELPTAINKSAADRIKALIDPGRKYREIEDKGENSGETANIVNMLITTNRISTWYEVDGALKTRINVVYIDPDTETPGAMIPEDDFYRLREEDKAIEYLLSISVNAYVDALNSGKFRADKFRFKSKDTEKYWREVSDEHSSSNDFLTYEFLGKTLKDRIVVDREEFIPNDDLKNAFLDWGRTSKSKMSLHHMKKDIVKWGEENGYDIDVSAIKSYNGMTKRGMLIKLTAAEVKRIEDINKFNELQMEEQARIQEQREEEIRKQYNYE